MTAGSDLVAVLDRALEQAGDLIAGIQPEQAALATPCSAWDVRALVNHLVDDVRHFTAMATGDDWDPSDADLIGNDWAGAYRREAASLLAAWRRSGAMDQPVRLPFGEFPASWSVGQQITDLAVHSWDLAKATGQSTDLDPEVGQLALAWGSENLTPEFRGDEASGRDFGAEVAVPDDAPLYDRLAGFFGRHPH